MLILEHRYTAALPLLTDLLNEIGVKSTVLTGPYVEINEIYPHFSHYNIEPDEFVSVVGQQWELVQFEGSADQDHKLMPTSEKVRLVDWPISPEHPLRSMVGWVHKFLKRQGRR